MKKRKRWLPATAVLLVLLVWTMIANKTPVVTEYSVVDSEIPASFHGLRIVHISDLHNDTFGMDNRKLLQAVAQAKPDMIVITGDLVDSRKTEIGIGIRFGQEAAKIAPTYYVAGNHEARIPEYEELKQGLRDAGVMILENESIALERGGETITLTGVLDPLFRTAYLTGEEAEVLRESLEKLSTQGYQILLSHRPEFLSVYADMGMDLVFSGHAHGGQFRIPFVGGLAAPGQGLFPRYDAGVFSEKETALIVSRGLGNSVIIPRINNRPEIVVVTLNCT